MSTTDAQSAEYHPSYSSPDGDIILRSDDGVLFRVQSSVLIGGSGFFRGMLEIPRDKEEKENNEPIVMQETSGVLLTILDIINPMGGFPTLESPDVAQQLVTAAEKLDVPKVTTYVRRMVMMKPSFLEEPVDLYILGCQNDWWEVARAASRGTLKYDLNCTAYQSKLEKLRTRDLMNLQILHRRRRRDMISALNPITIDSTKEMVIWDKLMLIHPIGKGMNHCRANCLCAPWAKLKFHISESMESQPSGDRLRLRSFIERPEFEDLWSYRCNKAGCAYSAYFGKHKVHAELIRILDQLPSSL